MRPCLKCDAVLQSSGLHPIILSSEQYHTHTQSYIQYILLQQSLGLSKQEDRLILIVDYWSIGYQQMFQNNCHIPLVATGDKTSSHGQSFKQRSNVGNSVVHHNLVSKHYVAVCCYIQSTFGEC